MLRRMQSYLLDDQTAQEQLEQQLLPLTRMQVDRNLAAFKQIMPAIADSLLACRVKRYRIFVSRFAHFNICDKTTNTVLYGEDPEEEAKTEVSRFLARAPYIHLNPLPASLTASSKQIALETVPEQPDVLIMFGVGLGHQLRYLVEQCQPRYIILYEPEIELLFSSIHCCEWSGIFNLCQQKGIQLFFQLGQSGSNICADLRELKDADPSVRKAYCYRHYVHPEMDASFLGLLYCSEQHQGIPARIPAIGGDYRAVPFRANNVLANEARFQSVKSSTRLSVLFKRNMGVFKQHFPEIFSAFQDYRWQSWRPILDEDDNFYLEHITSLARKPANDERWQAAEFLKAPERFQTLISQKISGKYAHYLHYQYMKKLHSVAVSFDVDVKQAPDEVPANLAALCVFGLGAGSAVEALLSQRRIEHLFIFEPNTDFFYASLFHTAWHQILAEMRYQHGIYFNLGGDGSQYYQDLLQHVQVKGSYQLTDCFFMQGYAQAQLNQSIERLKKELLLLFTNNEYFDAARFIQAHFRANTANGYPLLLDVKARKKQPLDKPVCIVGNGPSLDDSISFLQSHREHFILISCSTALKSLHRAGIRPDFHAEVEIQRATYQWISQIEDEAYLQQITLLSVAGVHPETTKLFGDTLLVLKEGDTSYSSFHLRAQKQGLKFAEAIKTYPTVSNFALSICTELGFSEIYLFGVDLGYRDPNQHHSRHSAYYKEDGSALYNFAKVHGDSHAVAGNFQPSVLTNANFSYARSMMEALIRESTASTTIFNCSDGAFIKGTTPLAAEQVSFRTNEGNAASIELIKKHYFHKLTEAQQASIFSAYDHTELQQQIKQLLAILNKPATNYTQAKALLDEHWQFLLDSYFAKNPLLALLFWGEANYFSAALCKFLAFDTKQAAEVPAFQAALNLYREFLAEASQQMQDYAAFDKAGTRLFG